MGVSAVMSAQQFEFLLTGDLLRRDNKAFIKGLRANEQFPFLPRRLIRGSGKIKSDAGGEEGHF